MLYLYETSSCHLCEEARALLLTMNQIMAFTWTEIDIADEENLLQRYSLKIPVLYRVDNNTELCWPFTEVNVSELLAAKNKKAG